MDRITKRSFVVIGKEGSTDDGQGFIDKLWEDACSHLDEIAHLAKKDDNGNFAGMWGAMTDPSRSFLPWQCNFSRGLYLAGAECEDDAEAPEGWTKWTIPGYEYIVVEGSVEIFPKTIGYMNENGIALVGAAHDYTEPATGKRYMYFPIRKV